MTERIGYEVEGQVVTNLKEVEALLGIKNIKRKDVEEGGKFADQVNLVDLDDTEKEVISEPPVKAEAPESTEEVSVVESGGDEGIYTSLSEEDMESLAEVDAQEIEESFPEFESLDDLRDFIRDLDMPTLEYMAVGLGLEWRPTHHKNIHRMRVAMELQRHFFPEKFVPKAKKKTSKYGDYSTEDLFKMAEESDIEYKKTGNEPIDRMRLIMELKKTGQLED